MKARHPVINRTPENTPTAPPHADALGVFAEQLTRAVAELKQRLQERYERAHPGQTELVRRAIAEAEARAGELSFFPHLFLPDLVEARIAELVALQPAAAQRGGLHACCMTEV
jgi:hypothetical protein